MHRPAGDDQSPTAISDPFLTTIVCPLCGSDRVQLITQTKDFTYGIAGLFRIVRCQSCRHLYLNPRPADERLMECYPDDYMPHHIANPSAPNPSNAADVSLAGPPPSDSRSPLRRLLGRIPYLKRVLRWLGQQHATVVPPRPQVAQAKLLEVGCAHGGYLVDAAAAGWRVDGLEPDPGAAQRARQRGFEVHTTTLTQAALPAQSRHAIVAWMVLEHVPDPLPFVQESFRVLAPAGTFCVSVPNAGSIERYLFGRYWLGYDAPRHLQIFSSRRLRGLLQQAGFVDVRVIHQSSVRYWWGSLAAIGIDRWPRAEWPRRWMSYFIGDLPRWMHWCSLLPENVLAWLHCSGRITVIAQKPPAEHGPPAEHEIP